MLFSSLLIGLLLNAPTIIILSITFISFRYPQNISHTAVFQFTLIFALSKKLIRQREENQVFIFTIFDTKHYPIPPFLSTGHENQKTPQGLTIF